MLLFLYLFTLILGLATIITVRDLYYSIASKKWPLCQAKVIKSDFTEKTNIDTYLILANALSPHPYLFWFSVGAPTMTKAMTQGISVALAFIINFYVFLVESKIVLARIVGKSKSFLSGNAYIYIMRFLGLILCVLAIVLFRDGLKLLEII